MSNENRAKLSDIAFSDTVKAIQERKGSRQIYAQSEENGDWSSVLDDNLKAFIARQRSVFFGSANGDGQPYIQHRGGPPGFLQVLGDTTIAFADYRGNKQYITQANLQDNPKAFLFLIDYEMRRRLKIWGNARVVEDDPGLSGKLMPEGYRALPEQVILFDVTLWNLNCPQHIPQRFEAADVQRALQARDARIAELEATVAALRAGN
ncbi:MAG: pyridoxamine 5'-phosphate oxidase family protein [Pseudomonadota bacterium]